MHYNMSEKPVKSSVSQQNTIIIYPRLFLQRSYNIQYISFDNENDNDHDHDHDHDHDNDNDNDDDDDDDNDNLIYPDWVGLVQSTGRYRLIFFLKQYEREAESSFKYILSNSEI